MNLTPKQLEALRLVADGKFYPVLAEEEDGWYARWRAVGASAAGVDLWVDEYVREAAMTRLTEDAEDQRHETLHDAWMMALASRTGLVVWNAAECRAFAAELAEWSGDAADDVEARRSLVFRFVADRTSFALACDLPKGRRALKALGQATYVWGGLRGLRRAGDVLSVSLARTEAEDFLRNGAAALADAGYGVSGLPDAARVTATAEIDDGLSPAGISAQALADDARKVRLQVKVAGEVVTEQEIRFLLDQGSSLVFFRDRWIEVDRAILKEALRALEKGVGRKGDLLSFAMGIGHVGALEVEELKAHGWIRGLLHDLRQGAEGPLASAPAEIPGLVAELRPYQRTGVAWLGFLTAHGFGALLADDMGLGKTIQTIAWILKNVPPGRTRDPEHARPVLIVAPLTLLANWRRELAAFAPSLAVYIHQGDRRQLANGFRRAALAADVTLTSYSLLVKDYSAISRVPWDALVLDEAQAIKNPDTQVARAVKSLLPPKRVALTGTPVENSVRDVWAIEDFLNPGFLGDRKSFQERFARPIALDLHATAARRLSHALEPFLLRRLKTDSAIAAELGAKREVREFCQLGAEERRAYEAALAAFRAAEHTPGDALALLTELKQVCDGRLSEDGPLVASERGKLAHLLDLLEAIFAGGESALVFTQYAKVGARLQEAIRARFNRPCPFLHGGLSATAREREIRQFARTLPMAFVLSLRAGGFGLNLTKATHVIHFDRWWNPAVENQATDRAHRIGQEKDVLVHLMITEGTVEERVDELLARKASLKDLLADGTAFWKAVQLT